jgi:hypothetical protein
MKLLSIKNFYPGEYYYIEDERGGQYGYCIFQYWQPINEDTARILSFHLIQTWEGSYNIDSDIWIEDRYCRKATEEEINWLKACIFKGKYMTRGQTPLIRAINKIRKEIGL